MPTDKNVRLDIKVTSADWSDLIYEVLMTEYHITVVEQAAKVLAERFVEASFPTLFINLNRVRILESFQHLRTNQPNEYFEKLVVRTFRARVDELRGRVPVVKGK